MLHIPAHLQPSASASDSSTALSCSCQYYANPWTGMIVREACFSCATRSDLSSGVLLPDAASGECEGRQCEEPKGGQPQPPVGAPVGDCISGAEEKRATREGPDTIDASGGDGGGAPVSDGIAGGLLSDEPGIGKTLTAIGLICANPATPQPFGYQTPPSRAASGTSMLAASCERALQHTHDALACALLTAEPPETGYAVSNMWRSRATLVIVPPNLLHQWKSELEAWAPHLAVYVYDGCAEAVKQASSAAACQAAARAGSTREHHLTAEQVEFWLSLAPLLLADVVLVSATTLASDATYMRPGIVTNVPSLAQDDRIGAARSSSGMPAHHRILRTCFLPSVWFHRLIVDEIQLLSVGASVRGSSKVGSVLHRLHSRYRWCLSGTPLEDANNLATLLILLRHDPFGRPFWWSRVCKPLLDDVLRGQAAASAADAARAASQPLPPPATAKASASRTAIVSVLATGSAGMDSVVEENTPASVNNAVTRMDTISAPQLSSADAQRAAPGTTSMLHSHAYGTSSQNSAHMGVDKGTEEPYTVAVNGSGYEGSSALSTEDDGG
ncbi:MAG: hypothetical protein EOO65_04100, partial [Methanosarcinales archaeon]